MRKIGFSKFEMDAAKVLEDSEAFLVVPAVVAREGVFPYSEGSAFKPADELKAAAFTAEGAWVVADKHPDTMILTMREDIAGRLESTKFDEGLKGITGNIRFYKGRCKPDFLADVKSGKRRDVSIGFFYDFDETPGVWKGEKYDFVQRNILIDHLAAGVPVGRCPSPYCGISVDSFVRKVAVDPWEETADYIRSGHKAPSDTCRMIEISLDQGIKAIYCDYGSKWDIQSYLFAKLNGWTLEKAKAWFDTHKQDADAQWDTVYIDKLPDGCFAYIEDGGKKDAEGKTVPRSLRHLPFKDATEQIDHDHLVNALARVKQPGTLPEGGKQAAIGKLCSAVRSWNTSHPDSKIQSEVCGVSGECAPCPFKEISRARMLRKS